MCDAAGPAGQPTGRSRGGGTNAVPGDLISYQGADPWKTVSAPPSMLGTPRAARSGTPLRVLRRRAGRAGRVERHDTARRALLDPLPAVRGVPGDAPGRGGDCGPT